MADPKLTSETVLVGCKLPHGLCLDLYVGTTLKSRVKLAGVAYFRIPNEDRKFVNPDVQLGHTLNSVPRKHWEEWIEKNKNHPAVINGFIFVSKTMDDARAQARERENEATGFEQVDPKQLGVKKLDNDPRPEEIR